MADMIVDSTNKNIQEYRAQRTAPLDDTTPYVKETSSTEVYAVFGLRYFRGLFVLNNHRVATIFSEKTGHPAFGATMPRDPF